MPNVLKIGSSILTSNNKIIGYDRSAGIFYKSKISQSAGAFNFIDKQKVSIIGVATDYDSGRLFVPNGGNHTVSVLDYTTKSLLYVISKVQGSFNVPTGIVVDKQKSRILVCNSLSNNISVLDYNNPTQLISSFGSGLNTPSGIDIDPSGSRIFVASPYSQTIHVYDYNSLSLIQTINSAGYPSDIIADTSAQRLFVSRWIDGKIETLNYNTYSSLAVTNLSTPISLKINKANGKLFVVAGAGSCYLSQLNYTNPISVVKSDVVGSPVYNLGLAILPTLDEILIASTTHEIYIYKTSI